MFLINRELNYGRSQLGEFAAKLSKLPRLKNTGNLRILDCGVGNGDDLINFSKYFDHADLHGVDFSYENANKLKSLGITLQKVNLDEEKLPFPDDFFDIVIINQVLEHCKEIYLIHAELCRVIRPDGFLVVGVPNLLSFHNRLLIMSGYHPTTAQLHSAHVRSFSKAGYLSFLSRVSGGSYSLVSFRGANFYPFSSRIAKLLAKILPNFSVSIFFLLQVKDHDPKLYFDAVEGLETNYKCL